MTSRNRHQRETVECRDGDLICAVLHIFSVTGNVPHADKLGVRPETASITKPPQRAQVRPRASNKRGGVDEHPQTGRQARHPPHQRGRNARTLAGPH